MAGIGRASLGTAKMIKQMPLPKKKLKRYAVHEAGHLISFALYDTYPDTLKVWIKPFAANPNGSNYFEYKEPSSNINYYENLMLTHLSGGCAVTTLLEKNTIGNENDLTGWEDIAREFLTAFKHDYYWFIRPNNEAEAKVNARPL